MNAKEHIENERRIFDIYSGILFNNQTFAAGEAGAFTYGFDCPEYKTILEKYGIDRIAGKGTAFVRAKRLLHWMAPKLTHKGDYDNQIPCNALDLLAYSLDNPAQGINCLNKAKILTECCLAVGIYARRVCLMPYSPYDGDNHVVTEIYDGDMGKWILLDPSTDGYFADEEGQPLSTLALRDKFAHQAFATFLTCTNRKTDLRKLQEKHAGLNTYFCKNLFYLTVDSYNGFGKADGKRLCFLPTGYDLRKSRLANVEYRIRQYPEGEARLREWLAELEARPMPSVCSPELLNLPPQ